MIMINSMLDVSALFEKNIVKYVDDIKFKEMYPNFSNVRVGGDHPFAIMFGKLYGSTNQSEKDIFQQDLFPSVTIVSTNDRKDSAANVRTLKEEYKITQDAIDKIEANREVFMIPDSQLDELKELYATDPDGVFADRYEQRRLNDMVVEIWSENKKIKEIIYDYVENYLIMKGRNYFKCTYDIEIQEDSINGERDGNYNYDFGKTLYGGIIKFNTSYPVAQYEIIDVEVAAEVDVNINELLKD